MLKVLEHLGHDKALFNKRMQQPRDNHPNNHGKIDPDVEEPTRMSLTDTTDAPAQKLAEQINNIKANLINLAIANGHIFE